MLLFIICLPLLLGTLLTGCSGARLSAGHRGRTAGIAAAITAASLALLLLQAPAVMRGEVLYEFIPWVPEIGMNVGLRLDGLALMFALLITGIGLLIIVYAHFYLGKSDPVGKFFSTLMLFMAA
ncbi:MAG: monovalent cation/H+ antiporter subunit A, partial [Polaromonas sp.]|nr:monovalent cation/H+ antiporter subunit A [Polaromonas sp.]